MTVRYPIAGTAEAALKAPSGRAAREREAAAGAGHAVSFARELTGPAFATRAEAEAAYAGLIDAEGQPSIATEDRFCELVEIAAPEEARASRGGQAEPTFQAGRRWPEPRRRLKTVWRLSVAYWRVGEPGSDEAAAADDAPQARKARREGASQGLDPETLRAISRQPMRPVKPQQPLDIGLFEVRPPEAPHIIMPDE